VAGVGDSTFVWLPGSATWKKTAFSGGVMEVAIAPGVAIAAVGPQVSISTAAVP
jgi:hypothetical protein